MPQGLQVFDEKGHCTLDVTTRITKYLGMVDTGLAQSGSLVNPLLKEGELWVLPLMMEMQSGTYEKVDIVDIWRSGDTLHWDFSGEPTDTRVGWLFLYGIY